MVWLCWTEWNGFSRTGEIVEETWGHRPASQLGNCCKAPITLGPIICHGLRHLKSKDSYKRIMFMMDLTQ